MKFYGLTAIVSLIMISILIVIALVDWQTMMMPEFLLVLLALASFILVILKQPVNIIAVVCGGGIISGLMGVFNLCYDDCFGWGDVKIMAIMGAVLKVTGIVKATLIAVITAGIVAGYIRYFKKSKQQYLPFAPFLVFGIIFILFR